jgi:hypothetical protein
LCTQHWRLARQGLERDLADRLERALADQRDRPAPGKLIRTREQRLDGQLGDGSRARRRMGALIVGHNC